MKKIITIATGTEILLGQTVDVDFSLIARGLAREGLFVTRHYVVGDDLVELKKVFLESLAQADVVILTGGLGPTTDDLTREMASDVLSLPLRMNEAVLDDIARKFESRGLEIPECAKLQALVLEGAEVITNGVGTAPGMYLNISKNHIFLLPGPPFEMQPMFEKDVLPRMKNLLEQKRFCVTTFKTFGIRESSVQEMIKKEFQAESNFLLGIGYCSSPEGVDVRISCSEDVWPSIRSLARRLEGVLEPWIFGKDEETLHEVVANLLMKQKKTLSIAESCTGGLICERLTRIPGISEVFKLGIVAYSNESKMNLLDIRSEDLSSHGAVSEVVALRMAEMIRRQGGTELGLAVTGIAGPGGSSSDKPVGLVWIAIHDGRKEWVRSFRFLGPRNVIQIKSAQASLDLVRRVLVGKRFASEEVS